MNDITLNLSWRKNPTAEKSNKARIVTGEKILLLLCEGGETSLVRQELKVLTSSPPSFILHEGKNERTAWVDICTTPVHFDDQVVKGSQVPEVLAQFLSLTSSHRQKYLF